MSKRITIVFDDEILKKLRVLEDQIQATSTKFVSFSSVVNGILRTGLTS